MNESRNPYSPPESHVGDPEAPISTESGQFIPYGRSLSPGRGAGWIGDAWRLLRGQPGMWAAALILLLVAYLVLSMIPFVNMFLQLLVPFIYAGIATAAYQQRSTGTFELDALLAGFSKRPVSLLAIGGTAILAGIVFLVVLAIFIGAEAFGMMMRGAQPDPGLFLSAKFWLAFLVSLAVTVPLGFATLLSPQLVILHDQPAMTAMKMSLAGCFKNILPGIVFLICSVVLVVISMIPLLLGLLISLPILVLTNYTMYRDIFVDEGA